MGLRLSLARPAEGLGARSPAAAAAGPGEDLPRHAAARGAAASGSVTTSTAHPRQPGMRGPGQASSNQRQRQRLPGGHRRHIHSHSQHGRQK